MPGLTLLRSNVPMLHQIPMIQCSTNMPTLLQCSYPSMFYQRSSAPTPLQRSNAPIGTMIQRSTKHPSVSPPPQHPMHLSHTNAPTLHRCSNAPMYPILYYVQCRID